MRRGKTALYLLAISFGTAALMILWPVRQPVRLQTAVVEGGELVHSLLLTATAAYAQETACMSLKSGTIREAYVSAGQQVQSGDLLFVLDTTQEEQLLSALYQKKHLLETADADWNEAVAALAVQNRLELAETEGQLLAAIEMAHIRAPADGLVRAVYAAGGDRVMEASVLAMVSSRETALTAAVRNTALSDVQPGAPAVGTCGTGESFPLVLKTIGAPDPESGMQQLTFSGPFAENLQAGETVQVELVTGTEAAEALIPLSAVDEEGLVWYLENGKVCFGELDELRLNRSYAAASAEWKGRTVILYPQKQALAEGMTAEGTDGR